MLRISILGAGYMANKMCTAFEYLRDRGEVELHAVAARDAGRARDFAARHGIATSYGSYEELAADPDPGLVYIATTNTQHFEHLRLCVERGLDVLCEKPFTPNAAQAAEIFEIARRSGSFVCEALWTRFLPAAKLIADIVAGGEIGAPRLVEASFCVPIDHKVRVQDPALAGGALLDLGIYPLAFALQQFGNGYRRIDGHAVLTPGGVDDQSQFCLEYDDGRFASLATSMTAGGGAPGRLSGTKGHIILERLLKCEEFVVELMDGTRRTVSCPFESNGYEYEIRACAAALSAGKKECAECTWADTLASLRTMDSLRSLWGVRYPFEP